jgi:hypothetical protein
MLLQVLTDTRPVRLHRDTVLGQMRARTDAVAHQHDRALQRTGGHDHLPRRDSGRFAVVRQARRLHAPTGDDEPVERLGRRRTSGDR